MKTKPNDAFAQVWQRVKEPAALFDPESLKGLIALQWQEAATYLYLSRRLGGREGTQLHNLFTQCQSHTACLKGIYTLATVKRLRRRNGEIWLMPENEAYAPIDGTYAQIVGVVKALVREY